MKPLIQLEIGFYKENEAYVSISSMSEDFSRQYQDVLLLSSYNLRQMSNIDPTNPICISLAQTLFNRKPEDARLPLLLTVAPPNPSLFRRGGLDPIKVSTKDILIVKRKKAAERRFTARIDNEGTKVYFTLDHHGFGNLGKGINYYVPVSIGILLNFMVNQHREDLDYIAELSNAASCCGRAVLEKRLDLHNAWSLAVDITHTILQTSLQSRTFNRAVDLFSKLRSLDRTDKKFWTVLSEIQGLCQKAIGLNKSDGSAHVMLANVYLILAFGVDAKNFPKEYSQNIFYCAAVIQKWKTNPTMHKKEKEQGEKIFLEVLKRIQEDDFRKPNEIDFELGGIMQYAYKIYYPPAIGLEGFKRLSEYITIFDEALKINPQDILAWHEKGRCLAALGRHEEAVECYNKNLELYPQDARAWYNIGNSVDALGRKEDALYCYGKALEFNPQDDAAWNNKAVILNNLGRQEEALYCCEKALKINPQACDTWNNKGISLAALGRHVDALLCYDNAIKIDSQFSNPWNNKGISLTALGRQDEAIQCYDMARKIKNDL